MLLTIPATSATSTRPLVPEGDTLHRIANAMQVLVGERVRELSLPRQGLGASVRGDVVTAVRAVGKNLLVSFSGGLVLHTHLKMTGLWHVYAPQERWRRPARMVVAIIDVGTVVAVCFQAPLVRLIDKRRAEREIIAPLARLDLIAETCDLDEVIQRLRALPAETPLGVALLEQAHVAGVGNVYKSEGLFRAGLSPLAPLVAISDADLRRLLTDLQQLMRDNVASGVVRGDDAMGPRSAAVEHYRYTRTTTGTPFPVVPVVNDDAVVNDGAAEAKNDGAPDGIAFGSIAEGELPTRTTRTGCERGKGPIAVYGRVGSPCPVCDATIAMVRQGSLQRSTYFCPRCQPLSTYPESL